ncbi:protein EARLY FLOWERING 3-like [Gossypium australe]|uniref:Protein EARLY FLOWERING 3-like n=1 Tax=Gossypium australe TaxID=47621 RepID=A0A5B6UK82_9ROSI|nr:protein EARLY FLOWERING 3-like [Gossypium australe]
MNFMGVEDYFKVVKISWKRPNLILSNSSINILNSEDGLDARLHNVYVDAQNDMIFRENILVEAGKCLESASKVGSDSCLRESPEVDNGNSNVLGNRSQTLEENKCGAISRHKKARGASMVESISPFDISPDDIVGIIGERISGKSLYHASLRIASAHKGKRVQRLIAGPPHMLLEDTLHMAKPSLDVSSMKKSPSNYVPKSPLFLKNSSQKTNISIKRSNGDAVANLPLPSGIDDTKEREIYCQLRWHQILGHLLLVSLQLEVNVYKPYTDPCPPTTGFLAPVYGNCGGFSNSHQQGVENPPIGQTYFLHYDMPVSNPSVSSLTIEQMSSFNGV